MTRKFDLRQIMKAAWVTVKAAGKSLSEALKGAWAAAKAPARKTRTLTFAEYKADTDFMFGGMDITTIADFRKAMSALGSRVVELTDEYCTIYA